MNLIIVGCGRIGSELAHSVVENGHQVSIIDHSTDAFKRLGTDFRGRTICGDVLDQNVLLRAGIEEADGLAAVTSDDATNFVVARAANEIFKIKNVVVRAYDPRRRAAFEALGIRSIASSSWGAQRLTQLLTHPGQLPLLTLGHGQVSLVEVKIQPKQVGKTLTELHFPGFPVAIIQQGNALLPDPKYIFQKSDTVVLSLQSEALERKEA